VFVNVTYATREEARRAAQGEMEMRLCPQCTTLFNAAHDARLLAFGAEYDNAQIHSPRYMAHMEEGTERVLRLIEDIEAPTIVDIGCGQGDFLRMLAGKLKRPARLMGFDPALRIGSADRRDVDAGPVSIELHPRLFQPADAPDGAAFLMRAVFGYFTDPAPFLAALRRKGSRLAIETSSLEWIVADDVVADLYYEYFCYYTSAALAKVLAATGWGGIEIAPTFGGQYLWAGARSDRPAEPVAAAPVRVPDDAAVRARILDRLIQARSRGPIAIWGAAGKGLNLLPMIDPDAQLVDCVIDINPAKHGAFTPVTAHPIVSPAEAISRGVQAAYVVNPIYRQEIARLVAELGGAMELLS